MGTTDGRPDFGAGPLGGSGYCALIAVVEADGTVQHAGCYGFNSARATAVGVLSNGDLVVQFDGGAFVSSTPDGSAGEAALVRMAPP